jgi:hypothetical protein
MALLGRRDAGTLRRFQVTPLRPATYLAADVVVHLGQALLGLALLFAVGAWGFGARGGGLPARWSSAALPWTAAFLAFGYALAALLPNARTVPVVGNVLAVPMLFLSGATAPLEVMPEAVQRAAAFNPLYHAVALLRGAWFGEPWARAGGVGGGAGGAAGRGRGVRGVAVPAGCAHRCRADVLPMVQVGQPGDTQRRSQASEAGPLVHHVELVGARDLGARRARRGRDAERGCAAEELPAVHAVERSSRRPAVSRPTPRPCQGARWRRSGGRGSERSLRRPAYRPIGHQRRDGAAVLPTWPWLRGSSRGW